MKAALQQERVGERFLKKDYSMIRVYGFKTIPFHQPIFLALTVFTLELIRHRLSAEVEQFVAHKNESNIKFPINMGPLIINKHTTLQTVECFLKGMMFPESYVMNYDPKGLIS